MGQCFGLLSSVAPNKSFVQAGGAVILLLNVLFCGYIVSPTVIPDYYVRNIDHLSSPFFGWKTSSSYTVLGS